MIFYSVHTICAHLTHSDQLNSWQIKHVPGISFLTGFLSPPFFFAMGCDFAAASKSSVSASLELSKRSALLDIVAVAVIVR
jgi:hypothetical protein